MEKEVFIKLYCENSNIKKEDLLKRVVVLPCNCNDEICKGWAVVSNNKLCIRSHNELYR